MEKFTFIKEKNFKELPKNSGVYCLASPKPNGEGGFDIIYIGKAINLQNRVKSHFYQPSYRDNLFIHKVNKIGYLETDSEISALVLEANLIKKYQPKFNVVWKDDKNYFYVAIADNKEKIPYVFITHQPFGKAQGKQHSDTEYIGPFVEGTALKKTLKFLRRVFPFYTAKSHSKIKCTYCHLDLCPGPARNASQAEFAPRSDAGGPYLDPIEYKKNIKKLKLVLKGKGGTVLKNLKKEMNELSKRNDFEEAAKARDRMLSLQKIMAHSSVIDNERNMVGNFPRAKNPTTSPWHKTQKILQGITNYNGEISRIECYDISNIQGKQATGSMVVFVNGKPDKSQYKKFKIRIENEPNDIAMLKEIITRRLAHKEWTYPEIMLIDGGIAQLNIAVKSKNSNNITKDIKIISIAKKDKDLYIEGQGQNFIPLKNLPQEIYNLILQLDDEAHRFAITYHKKLRKKNLFK